MRKHTREHEHTRTHTHDDDVLDKVCTINTDDVLAHAVGWDGDDNDYNVQVNLVHNTVRVMCLLIHTDHVSAHAY